MNDTLIENIATGGIDKYSFMFIVIFTLAILISLLAIRLYNKKIAK